MDDFRKAVQAYLGGADPVTGTCSKEPKWAEIESILPPEDATEEQIFGAVEKLLRAGITCRMLQSVPTACHRCQHSPKEKSRQENSQLVAEYRDEIHSTERLYDMVRFGLLQDIRVLTEREFEMLRVFWHARERTEREYRLEIDKAKIKALGARIL